MGMLGSLARFLWVRACLIVPLFLPGAWAVGLSLCGVAGVGSEPLRVRQTLDAEGRIFAPAGRGAEPVRRPITVTGRFDFVEEPAPTGQASEPAKGQASSDEKGQASTGRESTKSAAKPLVVRRYLDAVADLKIDGVSTRSLLGPDARTVHVAMQGTAPSPHLADAPLTRDEADLLDVPFDPLLLDGLRPAGEPVVGMAWKIGADVAAGLLSIDTIETGELAGDITEITAGRCSLRISGTIEGAVDGVPTRLVVEAVGTVPVRRIEVAPVAAAADAGGDVGLDVEVDALPDASAKPVETVAADAGAVDNAADAVASRLQFAGPHDQWVATIREHRQASHVAPGFEIEARVSVSRRPAAGPGVAAAVGQEGAVKRPAGGGPGRIWYRDQAGRYDLVHDARWRLVEEGDTGSVFRLVDRGTLVGQCSITALPRVDPTAASTVAAVQRDVETALGSQFGQFVAADESVRDDGVRVVRVVSAGRAGDLPFRWIHHVVTDPLGQRAAAAFMVEESLVERFGGADADLIAGLRSVVPAAAAGTAAGGTEKPADREARLPRETALP